MADEDKINPEVLEDLCSRKYLLFTAGEKTVRITVEADGVCGAMRSSFRLPLHTDPFTPNPYGNLLNDIACLSVWTQINPQDNGPAVVDVLWDVTKFTPEHGMIPDSIVG